MALNIPVVSIPQFSQPAPYIPDFDPFGSYYRGKNAVIDNRNAQLRNRLMDMYLREQEDKQNFMKMQAGYTPQDTQISIPQAPIMPPEVPPQYPGIGDRGPNALLEQNTAPIEQPPLQYTISGDPINPEAAGMYPVQAEAYRQDYIKRQQDIQKQQMDRTKSIVDIWKSIPPKDRKAMLPILGKTIPEFNQFDADEIVESNNGFVAIPVKDESGNVIGHAWVDDKGGVHPISETKDTSSIKLIRDALREKLGREPTANEILAEQVDQAAEMSGAKAMAGIAAAVARSTAVAEAQKKAYEPEAVRIGDAIISGKQPPDSLRGFGMSKVAPQVRAYLAEKGFDLTSAEIDWRETTKRIQTVNGIQFARMENAINFTKHSLETVRQLVNDWNVQDKQGRLVVLNKANLIAAKQGVFGKEAQVAATRLETQIADMTSELGTIYKGGNSATDDSLKLASENFKSDWSYEQLVGSIDLIDQNLGIRQNTLDYMRHSPKYTVGKGSRENAPLPTPKPYKPVSPPVKQRSLPSGYTSKAQMLKYLKTVPQNKGKSDKELKSYIDSTYQGKW